MGLGVDSNLGISIGNGIRGELDSWESPQEPRGLEESE
jgi:hypothetical protein